MSDEPTRLERAMLAIADAKIPFVSKLIEQRMADRAAEFADRFAREEAEAHYNALFGPVLTEVPGIDDAHLAATVARHERREAEQAQADRKTPDATLAHGQRSEEELQAWEDLDADLDREEHQKDEREDLKFSQYFRADDERTNYHGGASHDHQRPSDGYYLGT